MVVRPSHFETTFNVFQFRHVHTGVMVNEQMLVERSFCKIGFIEPLVKYDGRTFFFSINIKNVVFDVLFKVGYELVTAKKK